MSAPSPFKVAHAVCLGAALLLIADLALDWHVAEVRVAGVVTVASGTSGWGGAGALAGLAAVVVAVAEIVRLQGGREHPSLVLGAAITALAATVPAVVSSSSSLVDVGEQVVVAPDATRWPAWLGLGLAAAMTAAALVVYVLSPGRAAPTAPGGAAAPRGRRPGRPPAPPAAR